MNLRRPETIVKRAMPEQTPELSGTDWLILAGLLIATLLTFSLTFNFGWVYDDPAQIPQNPNLQWSRLGFLFTHQLWASTAAMQSRFYRPLLTLWFLLNKTFFGLNPHWFHVTTVLAHVAATALAFFVALTLLREAGSALLAAAIFGFHPLQVESASWISGVNDPLAAALCFGSFLIYRKAIAQQVNRGIWWMLAGLLFLLALFAKEVSIVLPGIILIDLWLVSRRNPSDARGFALPVICPYGIVSVFWLALRAWVLGGAAAVSTPIPWSMVLLSAPKIILFNLYRVIYPGGLSPQYDLHLINSPATSGFLLSALALIALIVLAVMAAGRDSRFWVAFAWLVLPMLPTLNLRWMNEDDFIHDRYLYMSMLGVGLLLGFGYSWIRKKWPELHLVRPLAGCVVMILAFASAVQSQYWANDVSLFSRAVERAPENEWAQLNYGSALSARGKFGDAIPHFIRSYELKPGWRAADFAAFAYQQVGDLLQAERWFDTALQLDPTLTAAWFGLGQVRLLQHRPQGAVSYLKRALELEPTAEGLHYELGSALEQASERSAAIEQYKMELRLHPDQAGARKALDRLEANPAGPVH
ncbi:MAG: tetratricopeptide repeat protein [Candidatus Sulfotelmatobacter sp.]